MKKIFSLLPLFCFFFAVIVKAQANIITEWNFDDQTTEASTGTGNVTLTGGILEWDNPEDDIPSGYSSGCNPETLELEDGLTTGNWAYNTTNYPEQGTGNETGGFLFYTSTEGAIEEVSFIFNLRRSATASTYFSVYSSVNGTDWDWVATESNETTDYAAYGGPYLVPNGMDEPELYIRLVSAFEPGTEQYNATASSGYNPVGTIRMDNVRVFTGTLSNEQVQDSKPFLSSTVWTNQVTFNATGKANVEVYNLNGQKLKDYSFNETTTVNVNDLQKGIYVVIFSEAGRTVSQKVVKK